jgi:mannose/fructose/N-acetylgalactosamine-specific phosphotransferase system component IIC
MSATTIMTAVAIALLLVYFFMYMRHVYSLPLEDRTRYLKQGNPYRWFSLVFAGLMLLLLFIDSLPATVLLVAVSFASAVWFALKQRQHLAIMGFSVEWGRRLDLISLFAAAGVISAFAGFVIARVV